MEIDLIIRNSTYQAIRTT